MEWILLALFSAALFGLVTALEKRLIDHHLPNLGDYYAALLRILGEQPVQHRADKTA